MRKQIEPDTKKVHIVDPPRRSRRIAERNNSYPGRAELPARTPSEPNRGRGSSTSRSARSRRGSASVNRRVGQSSTQTEPRVEPASTQSEPQPDTSRIPRPTSTTSLHKNRPASRTSVGSRSSSKSRNPTRGIKMAFFTFEQNVSVSTFKGSEFYETRKNDLFLASAEDVERILCQGKKIRDKVKELQPGATMTLGNLLITQGEPLVIKKGGPGSEVGDFEYTLNRLSGMCAAYAAKSTSATYKPRSAMAVSLGLTVEVDRVLYYSATPGAEHFPEVFIHKPLLCALKQLALKKVKKENIARIASVKNQQGQTLADLLVMHRATLQADLAKFTTGGGRGLAQLEAAIVSLRGVIPGFGI